jgi:long-subunit fatty acid transport protein
MSGPAWSRNTWAALFLGLAGVGSWYTLRTNEELHQRARFTIGYLTGVVYTPKSGTKYSYRYQVHGQTYEGTDASEKGMNTTEGTRFLLEYDSLNPERSNGRFTLAVPDSIRNSPSNGWAVPPFPVPAAVLKR